VDGLQSVVERKREEMIPLFFYVHRHLVRHLRTMERNSLATETGFTPVVVGRQILKNSKFNE
jgi:hypothetical protein